jgi:predicted acyl esterase
VHYMGGALLGAGLGWGSFFFRSMCHPPDPVLVGDRWRTMWLERLESVPLFLETWLQHQRRDAYWRHGSVCEDYGAIQCPVYVVGGWTDGYTNAIPRMLERLSVPRKGLIGPWAHAYPHFARPGPQIGFLQETLRWWDHWLKDVDTGVMDEPMLRVWMVESVKPATYHDTLPGHWIEESSWPPSAIAPYRFFLNDNELGLEKASLTPRSIRSPQTVGKHAGEWCPFGGDSDQAGDQREDDARSLIFETPPLDRALEILGAPIVTVDIASDKPIANLVVRLCDVHPLGASLRVSYGILNLTHRDGHEAPLPLAVGHRYRMGIQLNDAGSTFQAGHRIRLALSTTYWPLIWPSPENATLTIFGGTLDLPVRPLQTQHTLQPFREVETAAPEKITALSPGVERVERIGLELGSEGTSTYHIEDDAPLSAVAELRRVDTIVRDTWQIRIETHLRLSCTRDAFLLHASLSAWEGADRVCHRSWDRTIRRDCV